MQPNHTLVLLASTHKDNLRRSYATTSQVLTFHLYLVRRNQGHAAPQNDLRSKQVGGHRGYTTPCTLTLKGGDGTWMSHEECRLLPYQ